MAVATPAAPHLSKLPRSCIREVLLRLNSLKKGKCLFLIILSPCTSILPSQCRLMRGSNLSQATWNSRRMAHEVRGRISTPLIATASTCTGRIRTCIGPMLSGSHSEIHQCLVITSTARNHFLADHTLRIMEDRR